MSLDSNEIFDSLRSVCSTNNAEILVSECKTRPRRSTAFQIHAVKDRSNRISFFPSLSNRGRARVRVRMGKEI